MIEDLRRKFGIFSSRDCNDTLTNSELIKRKTLEAKDIWFDRKKGDKNERYYVAAKDTLPLITHELAVNPNFCQELEVDVHMRNLQLCGVFVPKDPKEREAFMRDSNSLHSVIIGYIKGLIRHDIIPTEPTNGVGPDTNNRTARYLRLNTYMPRDYIDETLEQIGLCPKPNPSEKSNNMLSTNLLSRFKTQDKSG